MSSAEEQLKQLYEAEKVNKRFYQQSEVSPYIRITYNGCVWLAAEHIDLIANLVVERLKKG